MNAANDFLMPVWPDALQRVDIARVRFALDFLSPCRLRPGDFLGIGRKLRFASRSLSEGADLGPSRQALFHQPLSDDPLARRRFQKPTPAFVISMPALRESPFDGGDRLDLEVLFIGTGIPLIHDFLRALSHLGRLGLVNGEGCFEVVEACSMETDGTPVVVWRQAEMLDTLVCTVQPLAWLLQVSTVCRQVVVEYVTPVRLMVGGKPLRRPRFEQVFPFMLRRVTSMIYAHCGFELCDDPKRLLEQSGRLEVRDTRLEWQDWRNVKGRQAAEIGGFVGEMLLAGEELEELYWVLAVAGLFGIGKGAAYGAGRVTVRS